MPSLIPQVITPGTLGSSLQPVLRSSDDGLLLRPFEPADAAVVHEAYRDSDVRRWHARTMDSVEEARGWIAAAGEHWRAERRGEWAVVSGSDVVGRIAVRSWDLREAVAMAAYWVVPHARGTGVAHRALETATAWAFGVGFHRIELEHAVANPASCRVAEKAGYVAEGIRRSAALHEDGWLDMHTHARLAPGA